MLSFVWRGVYTLLCLELSKRRSLLVKPSSRAARFSSRGCLSPRSAVVPHGLLQGDAAAGGQPSAEDTARPPRQAPHSHPRRGDLPVRFKSFATALAYIFFLWGTFAKCTPTFSSSVVSFLLQLRRILGPGLYSLCLFPALTQGKDPQQRSSHPQGSQEEVVAGKITGK